MFEIVLQGRFGERSMWVKTRTCAELQALAIWQPGRRVSVRVDGLIIARVENGRVCYGGI